MNVQRSSTPRIHAVDIQTSGRPQQFGIKLLRIESVDKCNNIIRFITNIERTMDTRMYEYVKYYLNYFRRAVSNVCLKLYRLIYLKFLYVY